MAVKQLTGWGVLVTDNLRPVGGTLTSVDDALDFYEGTGVTALIIDDSLVQKDGGACDESNPA